MGKQQTKLSKLRFSVLMLLMLFSCFAFVLGYALLDLKQFGVSAKKTNLMASVEDFYWTNMHSGGFSSDNGNKTYYIDSPAQLAYLNYELTRTGGNLGFADDYTGCTFVLLNDIKMDEIPANGFGDVTPLWTPIEIGNNGRNRNITFDGNGKSIIGLHIKYENDATPRNVGFFAEMYGGVFKNVTFESPVITYEYQGESKAADDPNRPLAPVEIAVGVIAGSADSTYIENVTIKNPSVTVTTENTNGHNFYVGAAVGKMSFTAQIVGEGENKERKSINTVTPSQWGLNTVNLLKTDDVSTGITLQVNEGDDVGVTYGAATNVYFGGLVGVNINSKIVNATLRGIEINPIYTPKAVEPMEGNYYVGGLAGLSTQIVWDKDLIVAAGLYNNLLLDVILGDITSVTKNNYCGQLLGYGYSGVWIYNNMVIGDMPLAYNDYWGTVFNSAIYCLTDNPQECIANFVGGLDEYYIGVNHETNTNTQFPSCLKKINSTTPYGDSHTEDFVWCAQHGHTQVSLGYQLDNTGSPDKKMKDYNYYFESTSSPEFIDFKDELIEFQEDGVLITKNNFELMNYFQQEEGKLYHAIQPILKYEDGLTVKKESSAYDKTVDAIYQFRTWDFDTEKNEPTISSYTGLDYTVTFVANSPINPYSYAYWPAESIGQQYNVDELEVGRTYQIITRPQDPICSGYDFVGWKIEGLVEGSPEWINFRDRGYIDANGFYLFDEEHREQILKPGRRFLAQWKVKDFVVHFVVRENGNEKVFEDYPQEVVVYGNTINGPSTLPISKQGNQCVGWFLEENLPEGKEDADASKQWRFGLDGDLMPGEELWLYSGWINNFKVLGNLLEDPNYIAYCDNYEVYFEDELGQAYYNAYMAAYNALTANDTSNTNGLLQNLENTYHALRVDPQKLLALEAFNEDRMENLCPFLYDYQVRMAYNTYKETVKQYVDSDATDTANIEGYIMHYNKLSELFNELKNNLNPSVNLVGGTSAKEVQDLVKKYLDLNIKSEALDKEVYSNDSLAVLEEAEAKVEQLWTSQATNPNFKDVELAMNAYESAIQNLKLASAVDVGGGNIDEDVDEESSAPQLPISPMLLGVIIVLALGGAVGGYIGFDILKHKRLALKNVKTVNQYNEIIEEDDEGYF